MSEPLLRNKKKSYQFEVEKMFNCSQISQSESWEGVITCQDDGELLGLISITSHASKFGLKSKKVRKIK